MAISKRYFILSLVDSILVVASVFLGYILLSADKQNMYISMIVLLIGYFVFAISYKIYQRAWEYTSVGELVVLLKTVLCANILSACILALIFRSFHLQLVVVISMILILFLAAPRILWRLAINRGVSPSNQVKRTLVIGAGSAGVMIVHHLIQHPESGLKPVAFIDDDPNKIKLQVLGVPVLGNTKEIIDVARDNDINHIIFAIPSLHNQKKLKCILDECAKVNAKTQMIPMLEDILLGKVLISNLRDVNIDDLLGRNPVSLDIDSIREKISGKVVLITGAGGSIGSEICRQVCRFNPKKLLLLGHGENSIYKIEMELCHQYEGKIDLVPIIAEIQDRTLISEIMNKYKPDIVYHAAAHKHVPLMEWNPVEAVKNNIFGTKNVAEAASASGVESFVMISTDKAVNPSNIMGSTKRIAEMIIQNLSNESKTKFVAVRFGNVLGSRGSVIPLFEKQIEMGGPVTVTDPRMKRYFMTIPEAASLVIEAGAIAKGGEVFVLDMGKQVKIVDLARNLIKLSGFTEEEIGIRYTGVRPGEKLYEELLSENEVQKKKVHQKIFVGKAKAMKKADLYKLLEHFQSMNEDELKETLLKVANQKYE